MYTQFVKETPKMPKFGSTENISQEKLKKNWLAYQIQNLWAFE